MDTNVKICVAIPTNRGLKPQMALSVMKMIKATPHDMHFEVATEGYTIAENRNLLVARAIRNNCSHILYIDDDMIFPEEAANRLLSLDKDIVGVNYHPRMLCPGYMVGMFGDENNRMKEEDLPKEPFICRGIGFGVTLIKTKIFHNIKQPWFEFEIYQSANPSQHVSGMIKTGEDFWFCKQAQEAGYDVWCDPTMKILHIGDYLY